MPGRASALLAASTPAAAAPLAVGTHTMTKTDKKSFNQSLAEWKLFIYNRRVPGVHRQELGFDLALLPSLSWVPGCTLFIHNVGYTSDSEQ